MESIWTIHKNILMTSNNGYDRKERPQIPFAEYLLDVDRVDNEIIIARCIKELITTEINKLPTHMKNNALATICKYLITYRPNIKFKQVNK